MEKNNGLTDKQIAGLTTPADPSDLIKTLTEANKILEEENKRLRLEADHIEALKAERDAYMRALEEIYAKGMFGYINGDAAGTLAIMAKEVLDQYRSPSLKENDTDNG